MFKFCTILSLIFVIAKIFSLVTFSWWICLLPFVTAVLIKVFLFILGIVLMIIGINMKNEDSDK